MKIKNIIQRYALLQDANEQEINLIELAFNEDVENRNLAKVLIPASQPKIQLVCWLIIRHRILISNRFPSVTYKPRVLFSDISDILDGEKMKVVANCASRERIFDVNKDLTEYESVSKHILSYLYK